MGAESAVQERTASSADGRQALNIVVVGHVDHGKSSLVGRLLADTNSLPEGKLEQVRAMCERNARPFEYAFLLDALKNEQSQGITIDAARCFFKTEKRDYILHDAPGHIEFLKNMVTGAARAEAALLLIDAKEGIQENSRRHGYIMSMLGVRQVAVVVNKMDLVGYSEAAFEAIRAEYLVFLERLGVKPLAMIPISARDGVNLTVRSPETPWYTGPSVLEQIEAFVRPADRSAGPLRLPVQDVYKFTEEGDKRRIVAGTIESGSVRVGDEVVFLPSGKKSQVASIEAFHAPESTEARAGQAVGLTLTTQVYARPGELLCRVGEEARMGTRFRANVFWMGRDPMIQGKAYKLKIAASRVRVDLAEILTVLDASELSSVQGQQQIDRHDVAECVLETARPIGFDLRSDVEATGRFVIVDDNEIAGCGIVLEQRQEGESVLQAHVRQREYRWGKGLLTAERRQARFNHQGKFVVVVGPDATATRRVAQHLEMFLFEKKANAYYLEIGNLFGDLREEARREPVSYEGHIRQLGEMARLMTDAGLLFVTTLVDAEDADLEQLRTLNEPNGLFVVNVGERQLDRFPVAMSIPADEILPLSIAKVVRELTKREIVPEYYI